MIADLRTAHRHSSNHPGELEKSAVCGCFFCRGTFPPTAIVEWIDDETTALCPLCGIDSVIGDASGFTPTAEFLAAMRAHWFAEVP